MKSLEDIGETDLCQSAQRWAKGVTGSLCTIKDRVMKGLKTLTATSEPLGLDSTSPKEDQPKATNQELKFDDSDLSQAEGGNKSDDADDGAKKQGSDAPIPVRPEDFVFSQQEKEVLRQFYEVEVYSNGVFKSITYSAEFKSILEKIKSDGETMLMERLECWKASNQKV